MFKYTLSPEDVISYMLYYVFMNKKGKKQGKKMLWYYVGWFILLAIVSYSTDNLITSLVMLSLALICAIYTLFLRDSLLTNTYKKIALSDLKDMIGSNIQLEFKGDHLQIKDQAGTYEYLLSGFLLITEFNLHYFIKLNNAQSIIIPKLNSEIEQSVNHMIASNNLPYQKEIDFKL